MVAVDAVELAAGSLQDLPLASAPAADDAPAATVVDAAPPVGEATASAAALAQPVLESEATSIAEAALASPPVAVAPVAVAPVAMPVSRGNDSRKKRRRARRDKRLSGSAPSRPSRELMATGTPAGASPIAANDEPTATWAPKMPPAAPSVPWRKPAYAAAAGAMVPSLVIDDADPDSAERVLEERAEKHAIRRSFLPPILLDREDRSARQGGLTLAVIILLIAATLTLSYLMRRPSASGDGMTQRSAPATKLG
jgi:hypothetical protein